MKAKRLIAFLENIDVRLINDVNYHLKSEAILKQFDKASDTINYQQQQKIRPILWNNYEIAALFCPIFNEVKQRLKDCLASDVIYIDGMSPMELNRRIKDYKGRYFVENDLTKQDR